MELIAERPLYLGQFTGGMVHPGQVFDIDEYFGRQLLAEGKASIKPVTPIFASKAGWVTCIMPTKNRRQWVPRAIELFRAQTYELKELLIVDNGDSIRDLVPVDERITYIHTPVGMKIGALRNFCCGRSNAEYIAHWDDDDWYHPARLEEQVAAINGYQAVAYNRCYFDGNGQWRYQAPARHGIGSSLLYRRAWWEKNRFQPLQVSEDQQFIERAVGVTNFIDGAARMVASIHPTNTSRRETKASSAYKPATPADLPPEYFT